MVKEHGDSRTGMTSTQKAPLADMEPAPDTTIPVQQPASATVDSSKWPQRGGTGVAVVASPLINPAGSPSPTSSTSSVSDGRLSPTKGDSRADRFRLEQRKLLSAIKSDPKLGMPGDEGEGGGGSFEGEDTLDCAAALEGTVVEEKKVEATVEDSSKSGVVEPDLSVVSGHLTPQLLRKVGVVPPSVTASKDQTVGTKDAALSEKEMSGSEKGKEAKGQQAEGGDAGSKVLGSPARSGIRLGTQTSAARTDLSATRSALHPTGGKYSALCSTKARPTTTTTLAAVQRRTNITGLNGSNSPTPTTTTTTSSAPSSPSRSVLSRYPPATSSPPFSTSPRRPISSQAPTSTVLSRSSSGSSAANPRRPASTGSSSRQSFESSLRSSSTAAPTDNSGVRTRRASGEKGERKEVGRSSSGVSGGKSGNATTTASKASGGAGSNLTSAPRGSAVTRTASAGARHSTGSVIAASKTVSSAGATTKTTPTLSGANTPVSKSAVAASVTAETTTAKPTGASETGAGAVSGGRDGASCAVASPVSEKSVDRKSSERSSQSKPRPARDLSSDRTPRFV